jgi:cellobiose phosphorylase
MPSEWNGFAMRYRYRDTLYHISVSRIDGAGGENPEATTVIVDGIAQAGNVVRLVDDRLDHRVEVRVATTSLAPATDTN